MAAARYPAGMLTRLLWWMAGGRRCQRCRTDVQPGEGVREGFGAYCGDKCANAMWWASQW